MEEGAGANPQNQEQHAVEPTLNDEELEEIHEEWDPSQHHRDILRSKLDQHVRIISIQLNSFPLTNNNKDHAKMEMLKALLVQSQADVMVSQEDNTDWNTVTAERRPKELCASICCFSSKECDYLMHGASVNTIAMFEIRLLK